MTPLPFMSRSALPRALDSDVALALIRSMYIEWLTLPTAVVPIGAYLEPIACGLLL